MRSLGQFQTLSFLKKELTRTKNHKKHKKHKNHKMHKKHKNHKDATRQKHKKQKKYKNTNKRISDFFPLRYFLSA